MDPADESDGAGGERRLAVAEKRRRSGDSERRVVGLWIRVRLTEDSQCRTGTIDDGRRRGVDVERRRGSVDDGFDFGGAERVEWLGCTGADCAVDTSLNFRDRRGATGWLWIQRDLRCGRHGNRETDGRDEK